MTGPIGSLPIAPVSVARTTLNVAIFFATLVAVCASVRAVLPFPEIRGIQPKLAHFKKSQKHDPYDAVFIGSSRVYRQIIPRQFDEQVKAVSGRETRTFNFGMDALWPPESCFMLREILGVKPQRLRWVFIEVMNIMTQIENPNEITRRLAYWHDGPHTWMAFREISDSNLTPMDKWKMLSTHGEIYFRQSTNQGRAAEWCSEEMEKENAKDAKRDDRKAVGEEGFVPKGGTLTGDVRKDFENSVAKARNGHRPVKISQVFRDALERMIAEVRAMGAEPILFLSPSAEPRENYVGLPENVTVWNFRDPNLYPALFDPNNRYDPSHLNRVGAEIYTNLLAERFAEHLKNHQ